MRAPRPRHWWALLAAAITLVLLWPPAGGKSLAVTLLNWAVDPAGALPVLPEQLPIGAGDDPVAVEARDDLVRDYDALYAHGGWTRRRLEWKVAGEPLPPPMMRQLLTAAAVILAAVAWRIAGRRD
jgi:hypothetical protein